MPALILLSGCNQPNEEICSYLAKPDASAKPPGLEDVDGNTIAVEACIQTWGTRLARSKDSAREVAEATLGGCEVAINRFRVSVGLDQKKRALRGEPTVESPDELIKLYERGFEGLALFHVVQARAGHCKVP